MPYELAAGELSAGPAHLDFSPSGRLRAAAGCRHGWAWRAPPVRVPEGEKGSGPGAEREPVLARQGYRAASQLVSDLLAAVAGDWRASRARLATGVICSRSRMHRRPARPGGLVRGGRRRGP